MRTKVHIPRRSERKQVAFPAHCRSHGGRAHDVMISDLTAEGCCICTLTMRLEAGQRVTIRPDGLQNIAGNVRWSTHAKAGIEFEYPMYAPVAEHFQREYAIS